MTRRVERMTRVERSLTRYWGPLVVLDPLLGPLEIGIPVVLDPLLGPLELEIPVERALEQVRELGLGE